MKYRNVLFDIDNTLINSADLIAKLLKKGAEREGVYVPLKEFRMRIGQPGNEILKELGVRNWRRVLAEYTVEFEKNMNSLDYFEGIEKMFADLLEMDIRLGVVTSKDQRQFEKETQHFPMISTMEIITTSDLTKNPKPSGDPLNYTLEKFQLKRRETLYVGDSIFDMQAANEAEIDFAIAAWGALPAATFKHANYLANTPNDIVTIVR
ncbi:phosphoglycolate phosphatase [Lactiplantibacillus plantarum EGD-AQ4]|nr:phosphoglycolate phosphatase [Lactiplantibacillus plantarum EGD-AQ4]